MEKISIVGFYENPDGTLSFKNEISERIWKDRYQKNGETLDENIDRVARFVASNDREFEEFREVMREGKFFPAGRVMSNAGLEGTLTLNNCFVANSVPDSMDGIFDTLKIAAITQKAGGGIGTEYSELRPKGTPTSNYAVASGPVSFMSVFNQTTDTIVSTGRRGANMGCISVYHPDILDFIEAKNNPDDPKAFQYFNLSVMVDDDFMKAVEEDKEIYLHYPVYDGYGKLLKNEMAWTQKKSIRARDLWEKIVRRAYESGEPGILFYDNFNKNNNTLYCESIIGTNPVVGKQRSYALFATYHFSTNQWGRKGG